MLFRSFQNDRGRGILVYHLVDISLLRFPERLEAVREFYSSKTKEITDLIPDENPEKEIQDAGVRQQLKNLRLDIMGIAYSAFPMGYDETQTRLIAIRIHLEKLRKEYDRLLVKNVTA